MILRPIKLEAEKRLAAAQKLVMAGDEVVRKDDALATAEWAARTTATVVGGVAKAAANTGPKVEVVYLAAALLASREQVGGNGWAGSAVETALELWDEFADQLKHRQPPKDKDGQ